MDRRTVTNKATLCCVQKSKEKKKKEKRERITHSPLRYTQASTTNGILKLNHFPPQSSRLKFAATCAASQV